MLNKDVNFQYSASTSLWGMRKTASLTERKNRMRKTADTNFTHENPAFDESYDTFKRFNSDHPQEPIAEEMELRNRTHPVVLDHSLSMENRNYGDPLATSMDSESDELPTEMLNNELPSTSLRKVKGFARPGSVKHKACNIGDGAEQGIGPQSGTNFATISQVEVENINEIDAGRVNRLTLNMNSKKSFRRQTSEAVELKRAGRLRISFAQRTKLLKNFMREFLSYFDLWHSHLTKIQGTFGSGVASFFFFLRWLFGLNLLVSILNILFLFVPQIIYSPSAKNNNVSFTGLELITGEGWFEKTELYYGVYTNHSIPVKGSSPYSMPLAYLLVGGGYLLLCLLILLKSMTNAYKNNYITGEDSGKPVRFFKLVFSSWDYSVTDSSASILKMNSIYNNLVEELGESRNRIRRSAQDTCYLIFVRLVTNVLVLGMIAGSVYVILYVANGSVKVDASVFQDMLPAIVISSVNLILPYAFRMVASLEQYRHPQTTVTVSLARTVVLKLASIAVYVVALHNSITCSVKLSASCKKTDCWETFVGMAFYKLVLVDFFFLLVSVFFGEVLRRIFSVYIPCCKERPGPPGFDISRNVLDLIYSQGICWVGTFYSPLLPVINVIKLFLYFYIKRYSVMRNCRVSMRPFNASKMSLLFLVLLGLAFVLAMIVIGYIVINDKTLKPSVNCGPFRGRLSIYSLVFDVIDDLPAVVKEAIKTVSSVSVLVAIIFLFALLAYYFVLKTSSEAKKIKLLKDQIALAGRDKTYLIQKLRRLMIARGLGQAYRKN